MAAVEEDTAVRVHSRQDRAADAGAMATNPGCLAIPQRGNQAEASRLGETKDGVERYRVLSRFPRESPMASSSRA